MAIVRTNTMVAHRVDIVFNGHRVHWKVYRGHDTQSSLIGMGRSDLDLTQALLHAGAIIAADKAAQDSDRAAAVLPDRDNDPGLDSPNPDHG